MLLSASKKIEGMICSDLPDTMGFATSRAFLFRCFLTLVSPSWRVRFVESFLQIVSFVSELSAKTNISNFEENQSTFIKRMYMRSDQFNASAIYLRIRLHMIHISIFNCILGLGREIMREFHKYCFLIFFFFQYLKTIQGYLLRQVRSMLNFLEKFSI